MLLCPEDLPFELARPQEFCPGKDRSWAWYVQEDLKGKHVVIAAGVMHVCDERQRGEYENKWDSLSVNLRGSLLSALHLLDKEWEGVWRRAKWVEGTLVSADRFFGFRIPEEALTMRPREQIMRLCGVGIHPVRALSWVGSLDSVDDSGHCGLSICKNAPLDKDARDNYLDSRAFLLDYDELVSMGRDKGLRGFLLWTDEFNSICRRISARS